MRPPCTAGRPENELLDLFSSYIKQPLSEYNVVSDEISISQVTDLSLDEYCFSLQKYCSLKHRTDCTNRPLSITTSL